MNTQQCELIEKLYGEMYDRLFSYACAAMERESLAEEAVQETFRIACMKPEDLYASPNPRGWLTLTLKNTVRNMNRSRSNSNRLLAEYMATQSRETSVSEDRIRLEVLYENVADMEEFRMIKEMAVDGKSHLEMAQERGISVSACKKRAQRAREILKKKIHD